MDSTDLKQIAEIRGRKLGLLLAASTLAEEVKDELASLVEEMTTDQVDRLTTVLEAEFLDQQTEEIDQKFQAKLEDLVKKYSAEDEKIKAEIEEQVKTIESLNENN
jgi:hypothetical protein